MDHLETAVREDHGPRRAQKGAPQTLAVKKIQSSCGCPEAQKRDLGGINGIQRECESLGRSGVQSIRTSSFPTDQVLLVDDGKHSGR